MADEKKPRGRPAANLSAPQKARVEAAKLVYPFKYLKGNCLEEIDELANYILDGKLPAKD